MCVFKAIDTFPPSSMILHAKVSLARGIQGRYNYGGVKFTRVLGVNLSRQNSSG